MHERPEFSFDRPFTVSRPGGFTCNGRRYRSGDLFEWRELGLGDAEIWDLWVLCQVDNTPAPATSAPEHNQSSDPIAELLAPVDLAEAACGAVPIVTAAEPPIAVTATPTASAAQGTLPLATRPPPSSPPRAIGAKSLTKPHQQNPLPRR